MIAQTVGNTSYERDTGSWVLAKLKLQNSLVRVAVGAESGEQLGDVVGTAGFHGDVDGGVTKIDAVVSAVIRGLDDIGTVLSQDSSEPMQCARVIGKMYAEANKPAVFDQAAFHYPREQTDVDIAAADQHGNFGSAERRLAIDESGHRGGARTFH